MFLARLPPKRDRLLVGSSNFFPAFFLLLDFQGENSADISVVFPHSSCREKRLFLTCHIWNQQQQQTFFKSAWEHRVSPGLFFVKLTESL